MCDGNREVRIDGIVGCASRSIARWIGRREPTKRVVSAGEVRRVDAEAVRVPLNRSSTLARAARDISDRGRGGKELVMRDCVL